MEKITKSSFENILVKHKSLFLGVRKDLCNDIWLENFLQNFIGRSMKGFACRTAKSMSKGLLFSDGSFLSLASDSSNNVFITTYRFKYNNLCVLCARNEQPSGVKCMYYLVEE